MAPPLGAQERFHRLFNAEDGLNPPAVRSLAQDRQGFLWIGGEGGLFRYDGLEMRRWAPGLLNRTITRVIASPEVPLAALREGGALFAITPEGAEPLTGPEGRPLEDIRDAAFDREGGLWILRGERVWSRSSEGRWKIADIFPAPGEPDCL